MKYEEPKMNRIMFESMDVIRTSNTPEKDWSGDNDNWIELD